MTLDDIITQAQATMPDGIDPSRVEAIYTDSLAEDLPDTDARYTIVEGIIHSTAFNTEKLERHRDEVALMLAWLPDNFMVTRGGGWSFLNACDDRAGRQWTGLHRTMDALFQLGIGLGMAEYLGPRKIWSAFPGGMPYVQVKQPGD